MRTLIKLIKYYQILVNLYVLLGMLIYVSGVRINVSTYSDTYIGHSFYVDMVFRFCLWHRILVANMMLCLAIEALTNYNIYIKNDVYIMIISTIITIFISLLIFRKHGTFGTTKSNNRF